MDPGLSPVSASRKKESHGDSKQASVIAGVDWRSVGRRATRMFAIFAVLIVLFLASLTLVFALPQARLMPNLAMSLQLFEFEKLYQPTYLMSAGYVLDNYTDSLMLDTTVGEPGASPFKAAMTAVHNTAEDPIAALSETISGGRTNPTEYAYYWHGYQLLVRPALMLAPYSSLRFYNLLLLAALVTVVAFQLREAFGGVAVIAFLSSLVLTGFAVVPLSFQFSTMTYLSLIGMLVVLVMLRRRTFQAYAIEVFFVLGVLTAFFDLLTTPILSLLMPLVVVLIARSKTKGFTALEDLIFVVKAAAIWAVGYLATWLAKIALASAALGQNWFALARKQLLFRTGLDGGESLVAQALRDNIHQMFPNLPVEDFLSIGPVGVIMLLALLVFLLVAWFHRRPNAEIARAASVLFVVPVPYLWFIVASNHSVFHGVYTYRIQAGAVFAVAYFILSIADYDRIAMTLSSLWSNVTPATRKAR